MLQWCLVPNLFEVPLTAPSGDVLTLRGAYRRGMQCYCRLHSCQLLVWPTPTLPGHVEDWLSAVEQRMKQSLHMAMKVGLSDYDGRDRPEWVLDHPGQIVATVAQMMWARGTENALSTGNLADMQAWYQQNVDDLLGLIRQIRGKLPKLQRKKIVALVTTDVHARDIVEELINKKVSNKGDFTWMQQLRYYWERVDENEDCIIRHSDALIRYGYEYMGCTSRLVITPLTDRCWLTLTGSYGLKLGAAPAGPAGTGKTESSKDLAKAMAIQCVVFNCSDQSRPPARQSQLETDRKWV